MKKYTTQAGIMWGLRFIAIFFAILASFLAIIFREENLLLIYIFSIMIFLMSYIAYMTRITITDNDIEIKTPTNNEKYVREEITEIVIYGKKLYFGMSNIDLKFNKIKDEQIKSVRIQSNTELIKELLKHFNGKIKIEAKEVEKVKEQLFKLGASKKMF